MAIIVPRMKNILTFITMTMEITFNFHRTYNEDHFILHGIDDDDHCEYC